MIRDLNIPTLKLAYPTNKNQIISLINRTNFFLKNLNIGSGIVNEDNLNVDLVEKRDKCPVCDVKEILNNLI